MQEPLEHINPYQFLAYYKHDPIKISPRMDRFKKKLLARKKIHANSSAVVFSPGGTVTSLGKPLT